jgi:hypothetical protein
MKKLYLVTLLMFLVQFGVAQQQAAAPVDRPPEPNMVFDDDGGKVQIVPADLSAPAPKKFHGGAVLKSAQQVSIFLGSGWADTSIRVRQRSLGDLSTSAANSQLAELASHKISLLPAAPPVEDFSQLSKTSLNDLDIQRRLEQMLETRAIRAPGASTIYVVFLAPGAVSTLGGNKAGIDYAAYHNVVNLEAGEVRYVVVPFHQDAQLQAAAAARSFAEAALNPTGQGWF